MNLKYSLALCTLSLGLVAGRAQGVKFTLPGQGDNSGGAKAAAPAKPAFTDAQIAEEVGWIQGKNMGLNELGFTKADVDALVKGLSAAADGKESPYNLEEIGPKVQEYMQAKQTAYITKLKEKNLGEAKAFFDKLKENKNVVELPDGLRYEIVQPGTGAYPKPDDNVKVNYTGKLINGQVFDSSVERNQPAEFKLNEVIPGWTEGLQKINKGGKIKLYVPPQLAYGDEPRPGIPPGSVLIFDVDLLDINPPAAPAPAPAAAPTAK